ncbi:MAG: hypothetical protein PHY93_08525 [Bacteriovorax sp.]|nr:hypothetical protein [Bacteriovorax sp.]
MAAIYKKRINAIYKKALSHSIKEAPLYAVANALNTLWAIDIDEQNIRQCRSRVMAITIDFLKEKMRINLDKTLIIKNKDFMAHVLCTIKWHIHENETLSALSNKSCAQNAALKTKSGSKWFTKNGHQQIDFQLSWSSFFAECEDKNLVPINFERALKLLSNISAGSSKGLENFEFAKELIIKDTEDLPKLSRTALAV